MKRSLRWMLSVLVLVLAVAFPCAAAVEWEVTRTLQLEAEPLDVVVSADGRRTFVLTAAGRIDVYSPSGELEESAEVGPDVVGIRPGTTEDELFLINREKRSVRAVTFDFIVEIDLDGSPVKGPEDAPVVIAVFTDFQ